MENNFFRMFGKIISGFEFDYKVCNERFFRSKIEVMRLSGKMDVIPILVSEKLINPNENYIGKTAEIVGFIHSYNLRIKNENHLLISAFAKEIYIKESEEDVNEVYLDGYICKKPRYRVTKHGRDVSDIFLAVNRKHNKSDYIPCICWGKDAKFSGSMEVGTRLQIKGRIQSREYNKKISEDRFETKTAYEVSISQMEVVNDENSEN